MRRVVALAALLCSAALASCSGSYTIISPECPPDDSLRYERHPLGCGVYMPPDSTP